MELHPRATAVSNHTMLSATVPPETAVDEAYLYGANKTIVTMCPGHT